MSGAVTHTMPLEFMSSGERGLVVDVSGRPEFVVRLEEMGLHSGAAIQMVRSGSPCIVEINHHQFSLRLEDSGTVLVDVNQ